MPDCAPCKLVFSPWVSLVGGVYLMLTAGTMYGFSSWAPAALQIGGPHLSAAQLNLVGSAANAGAWCSVFTGLFYDRFGPRLSGLVAGSLIFTGYGLAFVAAKSGSASAGSFVSLPGLVAVYGLMWGMGSGLSYTVGLATNLSNFPKERRGRIVGVLVCFFGLSSGVFVQFLRGFFGLTVDGATRFVAFLAVACAAVPLLTGGFGFVNVVGPNAPADYVQSLSRTRLAYGLGVVITLFLMASALVETLGEFDDGNDPTFALTLVLCGLIACFLLIPLGKSGQPLFFVDRVKMSLLAGDASKNVQVTDSSADEEAAAGANAEGPQLNLLQGLKSIDFWLLFSVFCCVIGPGITIVNNLSPITLALDGKIDPSKSYSKEELPSRQEAQTLITMFSVFNTLGRMGVGLGSDWTAGNRDSMAQVPLPILTRMPREGWLILSCVVMGLVQGFLALARDSSWLWGAVGPLGLAYGGVFCTLPVLTSNYFGVKNFGAIFGFIGLAPAVGGELLGTLLAGGLADKYKEQESVTVYNSADKAESSEFCYGWKCYGYTFLVNLAVCTVAVVLAVILARRSQRVPGQYRRFSDNSASDEEEA